MTSKLLALHTAVDETKDGVTRQLQKGFGDWAGIQDLATAMEM
jgi:hypothetical protein